MVKPTKASENVPHTAVKVVTKHRLADGHHNTVFPQHVDENHWHPSVRNGHHGSHTVQAKMKK